MGSPLIKRLDALYQRAQMVMAVQFRQIMLRLCPLLHGVL